MLSRFVIGINLGFSILNNSASGGTGSSGESDFKAFNDVLLVLPLGFDSDREMLLLDACTIPLVINRVLVQVFTGNFLGLFFPEIVAKF